MDAATSPNVLSYAAIEVPTHRRRTIWRTLLRSTGRCVALAFLIVRLLCLAAGYCVVAAGQVTRLIFSVTGVLLLMLGGLRWHEIKARLMRGAHWVDRVTLRMVHAVSRNPFVQPTRTRPT